MKKILVLLIVMLVVFGYSQTPKYVQIVDPQEGDILVEDNDGNYRNFLSDGFNDVFGYQDFWEGNESSNKILVVNKIAVYADTIIVINPNTVIIWKD